MSASSSRYQDWIGSNAPVAVIGAGLIGASWAAMFSAAGYDVRVWDPSEASRAQFERRHERASQHLRRLGLNPHGQVSWSTSLKTAVSEAVWIQENAPEKAELKTALYRDIESFTRASALIASSTSALTWSELSPGFANPDRFLTTHPFNPAHLIPLIEIYGREQAAVAAAARLFSSMNKVPVVLKRDATGHVANRLASALWREAVHIVSEGIADVAAVDAALVHGPGLRWSVAGAHMNYHLGGGPAGMKGYLEHLGQSQQRRWATLGNPELSPEVCESLVQGIETASGGLPVEQLEDLRDERLIALLKSRGTGAASALAG